MTPKPAINSWRWVLCQASGQSRLKTFHAAPQDLVSPPQIWVTGARRQRPWDSITYIPTNTV